MSRILDFEDDANKGTKGSEEHVIRKYRKRSPYYAVAESLATLLPSVRGKAGYVLNELGGLAEIPKRTAKAAAYYVLVACN